MVPISEWLGWVKFMEMEPNLFHRENWYFAKLTATIKAGQAGPKGGKIYVKDELIQFTHGKAKPKPQLSRRERAAISKARHFACLGVWGEELAREAGLNG